MGRETMNERIAGGLAARAVFGGERGDFKMRLYHMKLGQTIERLKEGAATGKRALAFGSASQADMLADD